ncbi:hypothetical protein EDO6_00057 [Paenibacillus xylanexedens]|nr:hypothetical protein EDO6_00057 [Paenibacillus xylanexedens]
MGTDTLQGVKPEGVCSMQKLHGNGLPYQRPRVPRVKAVFMADYYEP